ncbi:CdaR family transcriptional regulator [Paenibacillus puldeungensis]|uniref:CdaR family transcriptional regulator n=1 Tax=Paenibacillus puldeungensis TaxID=696536 RepID=A0ABW3RYW0_9BACL
MKITTELALPIASQLMSVMDFNINIMDDQGIIVASGQSQRIGQQHEGALQVLASRTQQLIGEEECRSLPGSKPGVNLPIEFQNSIVGVVGITGDPSEVYKFGTIIKMNVEILLEQIHMNKQLQFRKMALEGFIMELIAPHDLREKKLKLTARSLQIELNEERIVMVVEIEEMKWSEEMTGGDALQRINERKDHFLNGLKALVSFQSFYTYIEDGAFFIAVPAAEQLHKPVYAKIEQYIKKMGYRYYIGVGYPRSGLAGYKASYNEARSCIRLSKKFEQGPKATSIDEWGIVPYLDTIPQPIQNEFMQKYKWSGQLNEDYKQTLRTFMDCNLDVKETAALLHVHRNTLFYRLDKISQLLQMDYRKFNDLVKIKLLLTFEQLQK